MKANEWGDWAAGTFAPVAFLWLYLGYRQATIAFTHERDKYDGDLKRRAEEIQRRMQALLAEIEHNAERAGQYLDDNYRAPAYRAQKSVYETVLPHLTGLMTGDEVSALLRFYSQVDQFNFGLGEIDRFLKTLNSSNKVGLERDAEVARLDDFRKKEESRLALKAGDMRAPSGMFYTKARDALLKHLASVS